LTEAKLLRRYRPVGRDLAPLYAGYYVAELLDALTEEDDPHPELFDLADETLVALAAGESVAKWVTRFELGGLRLLGHMPSLDTCAECGNPVTPAGRIPFGQFDGGVLCSRCREGKKQIVLLSAGALKAMAQLADPDRLTWRRMEIDARSLGELRGVMNHYLVNLLGRKPRMHEYLGRLGT
jgi:DNA repair protein RecO (recombination protein O)